MKKLICIFAVVMGMMFTACEKNEVAESKIIEHNDYSSTVSQNRVLLAQSLIESLKENSLLASKILTECNKKFDGDKDVLCKNLFEMPISNIQNVKVSTILNGNSQKVKSTYNNSNFASSIISQDSLVQIYYYTCGSDSTSNSYEGIVVIPEDVKERDGKDLLVIKKNGTTSYIKSDIDPDKNYLVISRNERSNFDYSPSQVSSPNKQKGSTAADGKPMTIVQAKFTSIAAKRTVESWWGGEPEVRVNVLYALVNPVTSKIDEVRNSSFLYPGQWIKNGFWSNDVKWNVAQIQCPFWNSNEKNYGRHLIWTEEDGTSSAKTVSSNWTDKTTGITTSVSTTVPATNNDIVFADSWIDYDEVGTGKTFTWAIIQFEISCQ
jgi:hypothetical protein